MRRFCFALLFLASCGGDDDNRPQPVQDCDRLRTAWCDRAFSCFTWTAAQRSECLQLAWNRFGCDRAESVTQPAFTTCMSKIPTWSCDEVRGARMPPECSGVVRLPG